MVHSVEITYALRILCFYSEDSIEGTYCQLNLALSLRRARARNKGSLSIFWRVLRALRRPRQPSNTHHQGTTPPSPILLLSPHPRLVHHPPPPATCLAASCRPRLCCCGCPPPHPVVRTSAPPGRARHSAVWQAVPPWPGPRPRGAATPRGLRRVILPPCRAPGPPLFTQPAPSPSSASAPPF